ncbi:MAG: hypothetical protein ACYTG2_14945 [Planctomycetota bacterium]
MPQPPAYFQRTFRARGADVIVRTRQVDTLDWLEEFLVPWFEVGGGAPCGAEADATVVTFEAGPGSFSSWRRQARPASRQVNCFTMDSGEQPWPTARGDDGAEWAFDDDEGIAVGTHTGGQGESRIDVLADSERPRGRMTLMRVLRECASARALSMGEIPLHAAAVGIGGQITLFVGSRRSGKSTLLVHALSHPNTSFVSNDRAYAWLDPRGATVQGMPTIVMLRAGTLDYWPTLRAEVASGALHYAATVREAHAHRKAGTTCLPPPERAIPGLSPAQFCALLDVPSRAGGRLARIVFPRVDPEVTAAPGFRLQPLAPEEAGTLLVGVGLLAGGRSATFLTGHTPASQQALESAARALAQTVPCLSCALGPDAYQAPSVWESLRATSA